MCRASITGRKDFMKVSPILLSFVLVISALSAHENTLPDFTGEWLLNKESSDTPQSIADGSEGRPHDDAADARVDE